MRDIIWTIIVVWLVWRVIDAFKSFSQKASGVNSGADTRYTNEHSARTNMNDPGQGPKKGHLKPDAGEYVDYEETK
ncbi:MAG: hypothetical protein ACXVPQ_13020 [Bacteroidia bacterium]